MIYEPGFKTMISQIYVPDDEHIDSDVQFGVTRALLGDCPPLRTCRRAGFHGSLASLNQFVTLEPGEARRPIAPIRSKAWLVVD
jgi:catechol 1,2-dioxygenase